MPTPLELTVDPAAVKVPADYGTYKSHIVLINDSKVTVTVRPGKIAFSATGHHACTTAPPTWLTLRDTKQFKLAPGQSHQVRYTVHAVHGVNGTAAIVGEAAGPKTAAGQIGGAVGAKVTVGTGSNCAAPPPATPAVQPPGTPWWIFAAVAVAVILAVVVAVRAWRKHRAA